MYGVALRDTGKRVEVIKTLQAEHDARLVVDVDLPGIGGIEFKRTLAAAGRDLPTIFIPALEPAEAGALQAVQQGGSARGDRVGC